MKILIPIDFSKLSDNAIYFALEVFKKVKSVELILFHSFIPFDTGFIFPNAINKENEHRKNELNEQMLSLIRKIKKLTKFKLSHFIDEGVEFNRIIKFSKFKKVDLIVMGTKGASGLNETLFGSRTWHVIQNSKIPVICVPKHNRKFTFKKILFATDYTRDKNALKKLSQVCRVLKPKVFITHFTYEGAYNLSREISFKEFKQMTDKILKNQIGGYFEIKGKDFISELNNYILKNKIDIVSVLTQKRNNLFEKLFDTSFTKKLACHTKIPLIAFKIDK